MNKARIDNSVDLSGRQAPGPSSTLRTEGTKPLAAVVGADGFVGGGLAKALRGEAWLKTERVVYGPATGGDLHISQAQALLEEADIILNCGGFRVRPGCNYRDYQRSHQGSTSTFVPLIKKGALLIHISSASVLGKGEGLGNRSPANPITFPSPEYALAKLEEDQYLQEASVDRGFRVVFLRPAVLYSQQGVGMVSTMIAAARRGISLRLYPRNVRQHLAHMDLLADVVRRVIRHQGLPNLSTFVVADPYTVTNQQLEETIREYQGKRGVPVPLPTHYLGVLLRCTFHSTRPGLDFKTIGQILGVMASDIVYDPSETYQLLEIDPGCYTIDKTLLPAIVESLKQ